MKKHTAAIVLLILIALLPGCCTEHAWIAATCTTPEVCANCEKVQAQALGHTWVPADCTAPKTCAICSATEGDAAGHTEGDWEVIAEATLLSAGQQVKRCTLCQAELAAEAIPIKATAPSNGVYPFSPADFLEAYHASIGSISFDDLQFDAAHPHTSDDSLQYPLLQGDGHLTILLEGPDTPTSFILVCRAHPSLWEMTLACACFLDPLADPIEMRQSILSSGIYISPASNTYTFSLTEDGYHCITITPTA